MEPVPSTSGRGARKKKAVKPISISEYGGIAKWSTSEKQQFLVAVKKHGVMDLDKLSKELPTKSKESINQFIRTRIKDANDYFRNKEGILERVNRAPKVVAKKKCVYSHRIAATKNIKPITDAPIDKWLQRIVSAQPPGYNEMTVPIARAFLYLAKYTEHPNPSECGGIDFKALYETVYYMLCGVPGKALNEPTKLFLQNSINDLVGMGKKQNFMKKKEFLETVHRVSYNPNRQTYKGKKVVVQDEEAKLFSIKGFNPLNIPLDQLALDDL